MAFRTPETDRPPAGERSRITRLGRWCYRWRSYLPLVLIPLWLDALFAAEPASSPDAAAIPVSAVGVGRALAIGIAALGLLLRAFAAGTRPAKTSDRLVSRYQAGELNVTGLYSLARHPIYVANACVLLGVAAIPMSALPVLAAALYAVIAYGSMAAAEDAFLRERFGRRHEEWAAQTPRFGLAWRSWRPPSLPFELRSALRREYSTWLAFVLVLVVVRSASHTYESLTARLADAAPWTLAALASATLVKIVKYRTRWLHVDGR